MAGIFFTDPPKGKFPGWHNRHCRYLNNQKQYLTDLTGHVLFGVVSLFGHWTGVSFMKMDALYRQTNEMIPHRDDSKKVLMRLRIIVYLRARNSVLNATRGVVSCGASSFVVSSFNPCCVSNAVLCLCQLQLIFLYRVLLKQTVVCKPANTDCCQMLKSELPVLL